MKNKIIGMIFMTSLILGVWYFNEELNINYLYDHHTSWLIILIQLVALVLAIREYKKWVSKVNKETLHDKLLELHETTIALKNAVLEFDETSDSKQKLHNLMQKEESSVPKIDREYKLYSELHDIYDNLISETLVSTQTKKELIANLYDLGTLNDLTDQFIEEARDRRLVIMDLVNKKSPRVNKSKIETYFQKIEGEIQDKSDFLGDN